jgi:hypothetical protein
MRFMLYALMNTESILIAKSIKIGLPTMMCLLPAKLRMNYFVKEA